MNDEEMPAPQRPVPAGIGPKYWALVEKVAWLEGQLAAYKLDVVDAKRAAAGAEEACVRLHELLEDARRQIQEAQVSLQASARQAIKFQEMKTNYEAEIRARMRLARKIRRLLRREKL